MTMSSQIGNMVLPAHPIGVTGTTGSGTPKKFRARRGVGQPQVHVPQLPGYQVCDQAHV